MEHLFLNLDGALTDVAKQVFRALGLDTYLEADSLNVLGGSYFTISILGMAIRLEENSYDYEDKYRFMIGVKRDPCSNLMVEDRTVSEFAEIIARILANNQKIIVAMEVEGGVKEFLPN